MKSGFRIEGQTGKERSFRTIKNLWEYTANDIQKNGVSWMTDKEPNADALTRKGDSFDKGLKSAKNIMTVAVPEMQMRAMPYKEKDFFEKYIINWYYTDVANAGKLWRMVVLHHVTVTRVSDTRAAAQANAAYYEVVMKIGANIDYLNADGTTPQ